MFQKKSKAASEYKLDDKWYVQVIGQTGHACLH